MNLPVTKIQYIHVTPGRRILAVSDIHGHRAYLQKVLEMANFSKEDLLFVVGDLLEKGPDSLGTLRYVMELYKAGNVVPLIGNVDAYRMYFIQKMDADTAEELWQYIKSCRTWYGSSFYEELAKECGYELCCGKDVLAAREPIAEHFREELDFLAGLPTVVETERFVFVHGGLKEKAVEENAKHDVFALTKYDGFADRTPHVFEKCVVTGHWPVALYNGSIQQYNPLYCKEKNILSMDGGCGIKSEGQLNLVVIPHMDCGMEEISHISYDELPMLLAKETQEAGEDSLFIRWTDREIQILEKGKEFSYVHHVRSGRDLYVPTSLLYTDTECLDYSDYVLPVEIGDRLSLVLKTSRGCIVKKNGVVGWYTGRYEEKEPSETTP